MNKFNIELDMFAIILEIVKLDIFQYIVIMIEIIVTLKF